MNCLVALQGDSSVQMVKEVLLKKVFVSSWTTVCLRKIGGVAGGVAAATGRYCEKEDIAARLTGN
ncbi:MAG: hypothetical protein V8S95_02275 [Odoribacter sp.]